MRLVIAGSRTATGAANYELLKAAIFANCQRPAEIVSGGAKGADQLGEQFAAEFGIPVKRFIPDWEGKGKGAGFIRNGDMAVYASEVPGSMLVALWDGVSSGTKQMIEVAKTYELPTVVVQASVPAQMAIAVNATAGAGTMKDVTPAEPYIFPQSHSSLNVFETCPRQYEAKYITKEVKYVQSAAAAWGDEVHKALESFLVSQATVSLPTNMAQYQKWGEVILRRADSIGGRVLAEVSMGITKDGQGVDYWDKRAFFRGKGDVLILAPEKKCAENYDWKTGKIKNDTMQLKGYNLLTLATHQEIDVVRAGFVWLPDNKLSPPEVATREQFGEQLRLITDRWARLRTAYMRGVFPPRPNGLCRKYCDVTSCEHHGGR